MSQATQPGVIEAQDDNQRTPVPAEGERRAMRGYMGQYARAGAAIYAELERGQLLWVGVADRNAGIADDLVLGFDGVVVGHQFKTAQFPRTFTVETLLIGAGGLLLPLIKAWQCLCRDQPTARIEIRLVTNDYPSTKDKPGNENPKHSAAFLEDYAQAPSRTYVEWQSSRWSRLITRLHQASGLGEGEFARFLGALRILYGAAADFVLAHNLNKEQARLAAEIASLLPKLVADQRSQDRWSRAELLENLGWSDPNKIWHLHQFPVGAHVQRNRDTEMLLLKALRGVSQGYIALVGPPGSGKSTLLQTALSTEPKMRLVRYLAYVPGAAQGVGRGEAEDFLEDITNQLRKTGLRALRLRDTSLHERREHFGAMLKQAGERYQTEGVCTVIVLDGLDHIPREERPQHSLLAELPLPSAIAQGVIFVLGTQRLDLDFLKPAIQEHAQAAERQIIMRALDREAVGRMADALGLPPGISRHQIFERGHGHPLATRYLVQALLGAEPSERTQLLDHGQEYGEDIDSVYAAAWREMSSDPQALHALAFIARAEAPMPLTLLASIVEESAIEKALATARHLLSETPEGWSIFHNSFRLFVLGKPRLRLGAIDHAYSPSLYRELAQLARMAPGDSPQRWLELRYRARAGDEQDVLAIATPAYFRQHVGQGRGFAEIEADIRLGLLAARTGDATDVTRLLLCRDEVGRRATALEHAEQLPLAMLAAGELNAACAFVRDFPAKGYEVVDAFLALGDVDRAKNLFEHLEPLSQLHTSRFQHYGHAHNVAEFEKWARRVFHFRDFEQIRHAITHLEAESQSDATYVASVALEESISVRLKLQIAQAVMQHQPDIDFVELQQQLDFTVSMPAALMVDAGLSCLQQGDECAALTLFRLAELQRDFSELPNSYLRTMALLAAQAGDLARASVLFERLAPPAMAMGDDELHNHAASWLVEAVLEHAELASLLGKPLSPVAPSRHTLLRPLQSLATQVGELSGEVQRNIAPIAPGRALNLCRRAMEYVLRLPSRDGADYSLTHLAITVAPVMARKLIRIGAVCRESEFREMLGALDQLAADITTHPTSLLRREIAVAAYAVDGDRQRASERLHRLVNELVENTPSEQLDVLADLVAAFARIDDDHSARQLLANLSAHSLGYALAARKDPQYALWSTVLARANAAAPEQRAARTQLLMRQVQGMSETEGFSAACRIAHALIEEGMRASPQLGYEVSQALGAWKLIGWPNRMDVLLTEMLRRSPELQPAAISAWCELVLPYYEEPHYRPATKIGAFLDVALMAGGTELLADSVAQLQQAIERNSAAHLRLTLIERLHERAKHYGYASEILDLSVQRWQADAPPSRDHSSRQRYDDASSLDELQQAFEAETANLSYEAPYRFLALAEAAPLDQVVAMFEQWELLRSKERCRYMMVERLVQAGNTGHARRLLNSDEAVETQRRSWSQWMGGEQYYHFKARLTLDGVSTHPVAFASFVDSLITGEDGSMILLAEIEDILPIISEQPDWAAIWDLVAEQLQSTREFQLGQPFEPSQTALDDTQVLAELLHQALRLPITCVRRQAQRCALQLATQLGSGEQGFWLAMDRLLAGTVDEPWQAMQTLLLANESRLAATLGARIAALANHRDLGVAVAARQLASQWGVPISVPRITLPLVYQLTLDDETDDHLTLIDKMAGTMRIEDPMGWTLLFISVVKALSKVTGIEEVNIRHRAAMFITEWGGLATFGQAADRALRDHLQHLEMRIPYVKPQAWAGITALRYVAGELYQAGLIPGSRLPALLEQLNASVPVQPMKPTGVRPRGIARQLSAEHLDWQARDQLWLDQVEDDVAVWSEGKDLLVLAEVSQFVTHQPRQYQLRQFRLRTAALDEQLRFEELFAALPGVVWLGEEVALDNECAPSFIRRYCSSPHSPERFEHDLTLCPNWLLRLGWSESSTARWTYVDNESALMAGVTWWQDAGPLDVNSVTTWGKGCFVWLTPAGLEQLKALAGEIIIDTFAQREFIKTGEEPKVKVVNAAYVLQVAT